MHGSTTTDAAEIMPGPTGAGPIALGMHHAVQCGPVLMSSERSLSGPTGAVVVEPQVMQLLLALVAHS